jgi:hypothetical protein
MSLQENAWRTARGLWGPGVRRRLLVNVNPAYRAHVLRYVLRKSGMKAIFLHARDARVGYFDILNEARKGRDLALEHSVLLGTDARHFRAHEK